jgi:hypothetical protein
MASVKIGYLSATAFKFKKPFNGVSMKLGQDGFLLVAKIESCFRHVVPLFFFAVPLPPLSEVSLGIAKKLFDYLIIGRKE